MGWSRSSSEWSRARTSRQTSSRGGELGHPGQPDPSPLPCHRSFRGARGSPAPGRDKRAGQGVAHRPLRKPPCASRSSSAARSFCMCWEHRTNRLLQCSSVVFCVVTRPACGPLGRGVQYGPVGMSAGQIKGSVTVPYTFQGAGSPLPRVAAAWKAALVHTDEDDLWAKQPVLNRSKTHA